MKKTLQTATLFASSLLLTSQVIGESIPTGSLSVGDKFGAVREGESPTLSWSINHPGPPVDETLTVTTDAKVDIKMIGTSVVVSGNKRYTRTEMQLGDNNWTHIFKGIDTDVDTTEVLVSKDLQEGESLSFRTLKESSSGGESSWRYFEPSDTDNHHVKVLRDGDSLPWSTYENNQRSIADFLGAYLDESQNVVLGDDQVILAVEMGTTSPGDSGYDMQDVIVLLTFTPATETTTSVE